MHDFIKKIKEFSTVLLGRDTSSPSLNEENARKEDKELPELGLGQFIFRCNICGNINTSGQMDREYPSCSHCLSSVRLRSVIHVLSINLFGNSIPLVDFPQRSDVNGIGISDWEGYSMPLSRKMRYTNTFFDAEPQLDILNIPSSHNNRYDFIICSDVLEHVKPPVSDALFNLREMLKPGGFVILTAPYFLELTGTIEHFPDLFSYEITSDRDGGMMLINTDKEGKQTIYRDLVFHGGNGVTIELRRFSRHSLVREIEQAGFSSFSFCCTPCLHYGILYETCCCPIILRK